MGDNIARSYGDASRKDGVGRMRLKNAMRKKKAAKKGEQSFVTTQDMYVGKK